MHLIQVSIIKYFALNTKVRNALQNFSYKLLSKVLYQNVSSSVKGKNVKDIAAFFTEVIPLCMYWQYYI